MTGAAMLLMNEPSANPSGLAATINGPSFFAVAEDRSYDFGDNSCTVAGGTSPYTYAWSVTSDSFGTWSTGGTGASFDVTVSDVLPTNLTVATYVCTVTDNVGNTAVSNSARYSYLNFNND